MMCFVSFLSRKISPDLCALQFTILILLNYYFVCVFIANDTNYTKIFGQNSQSESVIYYQDPIQQFHIV